MNDPLKRAGTSLTITEDRESHWALDRSMREEDVVDGRARIWSQNEGDVDENDKKMGCVKS